MDVALSRPSYDDRYSSARPTLAYLDDEDNDDDVVSDLTMNQFPRASRYGTAPRMSSILKLPTMPLRGPTIYGWLWKKGASFKTWKKRFFLLNGATLTYYTHACVVETEVGTRCFQMPAKGGLRVASADISDLTEFGLCVTSSSGRVLYLQAGDRASRIKWLGVLQEAAKKSSSDSMKIRTTRVSDAAFRPMSGGSYSSSDNQNESAQSGSMSSTLSSDDDGEDDGPLEMKGWLFVKRRTPSLFTLYKKRFVTLADGCLTLTNHARERHARDKKLEVLSATSWHAHEHGIHFHLEHHKQLFMYASSSDEAKRWLQAVHSNL